MARENRLRRRRRVRRTTVTVLVLLLVAVGAAAIAVHHLEGNVHTVSLSGASSAISDSDGKPLNVLLIGSDTRASAEDCKLGGACAGTRRSTSSPPTSSPTASSATGTASSPDGQPANADVEMLVHLSSDRRHATVLSIPRDTRADIPQCALPDGGSLPAQRDRINASMAAGPDCTVRTVEALTGVDVSHVAVIDFHGVVTMTKALSGVPVCVDADVYDPYSKLKLRKGTHTVQGTSALAFVRTRHGFGDGSDLGRAGAQHLFLSSLIREVRSASTLTDPLTLYDVADAATKALTVDKPLASASSLVALVRQLDKVPTKNITFVTMPSRPYAPNPNLVEPAPSAAALFRSIADDTPLPSSSPSHEPSPSSSRGASPSSSTSSPSGTGDDGSADAKSADQGGCAHVSTSLTVEINGVPMTPTQAYAASASTPDSAS